MNGNESEANFFHSLDSIKKDASAKRLKIQTLKDEDLITELPDSIIVHILSFLPTLQEAIRTGILSKRWKYLWTSIPVLDFSSDWLRGHSKFAAFIDKTLDQCSHSKLKKLSLRFEIQKGRGFAPQVNRCLRYAVDSNVEELDIDYMFMFHREHYFELPQYVLSNNSLTNLTVANCSFVKNGLISWKLLKKLSITSSNLSENLIKDVLSGSPVLEIMELCSCRGFSRLDITSSSLKKLVLNGYFAPYKREDDAVLEIYGPNILSLDIDEDLGLRKLLLFNMPSLVEASLTMSRSAYNLCVTDEHADENMVKGLLQSLHHVNQLAVGSWCLKIISLLELKGWHSPLSKRKCLKIGTSSIRRSVFPGLSNLLRGSPDLETLHVNMDPCDYLRPFGTSPGENYLYKTSRLECLQRHLKVVKIDYCIGRGNASELVQFLLENAYVLEKMVISCRSEAEKRLRSVTKRLTNFSSKLSSFQRASKNCVVLCPGLARGIN